MATSTAGTLATTTLTAVQYSSDPNALSNADFAAIANGIYRDVGQKGLGPYGGGGVKDPAGNAPSVILPGAFTRAGLLWLPLRGREPLQVMPGDWVANDGFGNVFLIPQRALPKTLTLANCTTVSGSPLLTFPSDIRALGWQNGTHVTGTNIPSGSVIFDIGVGGLTANLYAIATGLKVNATGSSGAVTVTAGTFTHS